ncbi:MAG: hypothetical protein KDI29_17915, partial [Pseudomonadales bacterium]|nr:hypothetical protein [Pseudomonadales bacterium]
MNYPLPISLLQKLSSRLKYPALTVGLALLVLLITLYSATGALFPDQDLYGYDSRMQVTGQFLVFTLTPPYLIACLIGQAGATPGIIAALSPLLPYDQRTSLGQLDQIRYWHVGVLIGVANALLFNVPWSILS